MTLVVGLIAKDGIIIASDSQATFETGGQSTRGSSRKVTVARDVFAFGMSSMGSSTKQLIEDALTSRNDWHTKATASALRDQLGQDVNAVLKAQTERSWNAMRQPGPVIGLIAGMYANGEPHLYEISANGHVAEQTEHGFTAIGSGDIFTYHAMSTFSSFKLDELPLDHAKVLVYRIIADAVRVAAFGIGGDVQMACIVPAGKIGKAAALTPEELAKVDYQVDVWRRLEREALDEVGLQELAPAPPAEGG